jgi:hypothetical protein
MFNTYDFVSEARAQVIGQGDGIGHLLNVSNLSRTLHVICDFDPLAIVQFAVQVSTLTGAWRRSYKVCPFMEFGRLTVDGRFVATCK